MEGVSRPRVCGCGKVYVGVEWRPWSCVRVWRRPRFHSQSGGRSLVGWLGGCLADWLTGWFGCGGKGLPGVASSRLFHTHTRSFAVIV